MRARFGRGPTVVSKKGSLKFISRFAADLLISINELLISINVVSASIFIDINK